MAKKSKEETVKEGTTSETISKADAVRAALKAGYDKPLEAVAHIKEKYGVEIAPQVFSSYKSNELKKKGSGKSGAVKLGNNGAVRSVGRVGNGIAAAHEVKALIAKYDIATIKEAVSLFE